MTRKKLTWKVHYSTERGNFSPVIIVTAATEKAAREYVYREMGDIVIEHVELVKR